MSKHNKKVKAPIVEVPEEVVEVPEEVERIAEVVADVPEANRVKILSMRVGTIGLKDKVEVKCGKVVEIDVVDAIMLLARYPNLIQIL